MNWWSWRNWQKVDEWTGCKEEGDSRILCAPTTMLQLLLWSLNSRRAAKKLWTSERSKGKKKWPHLKSERLITELQGRRGNSQWAPVEGSLFWKVDVHRWGRGDWERRGDTPWWGDWEKENIGEWDRGSWLVRRSHAMKILGPSLQIWDAFW
jgi:hypothetical protein